MTSADSPTLVLASASPRRADLLRAAGFAFTVRVADVDESVRGSEVPRDYVRRLAIDKAHAIRCDPGEVVLAADTTVVVDGTLLMKPADEAEARRMLRRLAGRTHAVLTGVCVRTADRFEAAVEVTLVEFAEISDDELDWYLASGEAMDKAGAYGIQGRISRFVSRIEGSYSNVVGLPVALVHRLLKAAMRMG